jgi:type I restriction enzyme S subunit
MTTKLTAEEPSAVYEVLREQLPAAPTMRLGDVVSKLVDGSHNPPAKCDSGHPMLSARNIDNGSINFDEFRFIATDDFALEDRRTRVTAGDVLLTIVGTIGRAAVVRHETERFTLQRSVAVMTPTKVLPHYLAYQLQAPVIQRHFERVARGTAQKGVYLKILSDTAVVVPEHGKQREIAAYLDEQLSRLDASVAALLRAQANLKRYRASVLKSACEGRLVPTEAELARAEGRTFETGVQLLQRILADRRARWAGKGKYKEAATNGSHVLPEAPSGWAWTGLGGLIADGPQNGLYVPKASYGSGVPIIRISDYQNDWQLPFSELQRVNIEAVTADVYRVCDGDILVNRVNSLTHLGKTLLVRSRGEMPVFESNIMRMRLSSAVVPEYVTLYLRSSRGRTRLNSGAKWAVNQASINQQDVCSCPIPLPPLPEQHRIVAEADRRLSLIRGAEAQVSANLARAKRLRQSILQAAFANPGSAGQ